MEIRRKERNAIQYFGSLQIHIWLASEPKFQLYNPFIFSNWPTAKALWLSLPTISTPDLSEDFLPAQLAYLISLTATERFGNILLAQ